MTTSTTYRQADNHLDYSVNIVSITRFSGSVLDMHLLLPQLESTFTIEFEKRRKQISLLLIINTSGR